jgi:hypothetical protein
LVKRATCVHLHYTGCPIYLDHLKCLFHLTSNANASDKGCWISRGTHNTVHNLFIIFFVN